MNTAQKNHRCHFVSFSGMDGAGKSTQISMLRARLQDAGLHVQLIPFWDDVAQLKNLRETSGHKIFKGEIGVGSPEAPIHRRDKNVRSPIMTCIRLGLYFLDAISLRRVVKKSLHSGVDFVICDRYAYDELANLTLGNPLTRAYVHMIMKLVPRPDVSYFLDADPFAARARKPEYPVEFLQFSRESYRVLSTLIGGITLIPPMPVQDVARAVFAPVQKLLAWPEGPAQTADEGSGAEHKSSQKTA